MEKNTILAVVLCSLVLITSFMLQGFFTQRRQPVQQTQQTQPVQQSAEEITQAQQNPPSPDQSLVDLQAPVITTDTAANSAIPSGQIDTSVQESAAAPYQQSVKIDTGVMLVELTNIGGDIVSWKLNEHSDREDYVDMIFSRNKDSRAFSIAFDGQPLSDFFQVNRVSEFIVEFISVRRGFKLIKRYEFQPNEYMFKLIVTLDGEYNVQSFNFAGNAYTLSFGPQIGPMFEKLDIYDFRKNHMYTNGKLKEITKKNELITDNRMTAWAAISGKYFTFIAIPMLYNTPYSLGFSDAAEPGPSVDTASRLNIFRSSANSVTKIEDIYFFYLGPKTQNVLKNYDYNIAEIASSRGILAPLENVLKWLLLALYKVVNNYGIAIILLTLLIKILFFPLTKKGSEGTLRMQALAPKIKEIQDKYKGNPQKLQTEMANFYKQEGYNPLSGCLPLLLQIPIFIAMYGLFNNHFDLRGASFIPGWIPDLSVPEYIARSDTFRFPFLGWNALRGLPFIYVASQLLYGKVTQMPGQQSNTQMKFMLYVMPVIFFFILYNVPSGLLIYWIFSNLLTLVQQVIINKFFIEKKRAAQAQAQAEQETKIAPGKKKKKNF